LVSGESGETWGKVVAGRCRISERGKTPDTVIVSAKGGVSFGKLGGYPIRNHVEHTKKKGIGIPEEEAKGFRKKVEELLVGKSKSAKKGVVRKGQQ